MLPNAHREIPTYEERQEARDLARRKVARYESIHGMSHDLQKSYFEMCKYINVKPDIARTFVDPYPKWDKPKKN